MARLVTISGFKKSGKTTVVENVVRELKERGYRVGTIKHVPNEDFSLDKSKTDTWRHANAGSDRVVALGPSELMVLDKKEADLESVLFKMNELDFVVLEGFKKLENVARIIVVRNESDILELKDEFTIGVVGDISESDFSFEDSAGLVDLIEERSVMFTGGLDCGHCGFETCRDYVISAINGGASVEGCVAMKGTVSLFIDGKKVPLKPFVQNLIGKTVSGIVSALKKSDGRRIEIHVEKDEG